MSCAIQDIRARSRSRDRDRYHMLHPDGRKLISGWLARAQAQNGRGGAEFESYIYLWIAFNGWAACVTGKDGDREWQRALVADPGLNDHFEQLMAGQSHTGEAARAFRSLWPIFKVAELRERHIDYWAAHESRAVMARAYVEAGARLFEPRCFYEHEEAPLDWGHTLVTLYRVRCNLFHGEKARASENDQRVVTAAFAVLAAFIDESGLLD